MVELNRTARRSSNSFSKGHTPFPNWLLDTVMPDLKDTEFRLLCLIVRQTQGWHDPKTGDRKKSDWITRSQMMAKTGRNSAALSRALEVLVKQELIEVRDGAGQLLLAPQQRREARGHLTYALHPRVIDGSIACSLLDQSKTKIEHANAPKANRTKETPTKQTLTKNSSIKGVDWENREDAKQQAETTPEMRNFLDAFEKKYQEYKGAPPTENLTSTRPTLLQNALESHSCTTLCRLLDVFFESDMAWVARQNHSLQSFLDTVNILLVQPSRAHEKRANRKSLNN